MSVVGDADFVASALVNGVHIGLDGWMFFVGGPNEVIRFYTEPDFFGHAERDAWLNLLQDRNSRAEKIGARYCHVIAPEKLSVYPEYYDGDLTHFSSAPSQTLLAAEIDSGCPHVLVDIVSVLNASKSLERQHYFKTDTHWNADAVDVVAASICAKLGVPYGDNFSTRKVGEANLVLDLGGKCTPIVTEDWWMRTESGRLTRSWANKMVSYKEENGLENEAGLHVGSAVSYTNSDSVVDARILVFGDSFCDYRDHLLFGALAENFREAHFVWTSQFDWTFIESLKPDYIVSELAERFMKTVPSININLENYVDQRLTVFRAKDQ
jgi:alginate O-acetyltransferase complex protein AlgJ